MSFFVDWIQFSIKVETDKATEALAYFYKFVKLEIEDAEHSKGINFYKQMLKFPSGIKILFDGRSADMGINIIIPGSAMDSVHFTDTIEDIEKRLEEWGGKYKWSRIDFATDTHEYDFSVFYDKFINREYRCKYTHKGIQQHVDADNRGTLYFGQRGGLTMFRIYDKAYEQGVEGIWTRVELESRNEACDQLLKAYKENTLNEYFLGHLEFVEERKEGGHMNRCETAEFYLNVINGDGKRRKVERKESDSTLDWFITQVAPTLKALRKDYGEAFIEGIVEKAKMPTRQIKERFDLRIINTEELVNAKSGEIIPRIIPKEYIQMEIAACNE